MKKIYFLKFLLSISFLFFLFFVASCKKNANTIASPTILGVYQADSSVYKELIMAITQIGNVSGDYGLVFDTGSGGMVIDADGIVPSSMISSNGFIFSGDSTVVNGITITNQTSTIVYGDDCSTINDTVYGNLAYAQVTVGDDQGNITIKRLPFFLSYKATRSNGTSYPTHSFDVFGVNEEYDVTFNNNVHITSPFSYFDPGVGLTRGFKMAQLNGANFSYEGTYAPVLTLGLTPADLSASAGFVTSQLSPYPPYGYVPYILANVTYNTNSFNGPLLFDTGTSNYSFLEDPNLSDTTATLLPPKSPVTIAAQSGFKYSYTTTATENLTNVENSSCVNVSIFDIDFFLNNEYMYDFEHHTLGLKNN